jgi:ribosomal protein S18 acetylase RimI-like enzyme
MVFTVRPANRQDLDQMTRLWREMMDYHARADSRFRPAPSPNGEQAWQEFLETLWNNPDWCCLVAERDGLLIGQIMGQIRSTYPVFEPQRYCYVTDIVVLPEARQGGVGRSLFEALKDWAHSRDADYVELRVAHRNQASQAFWRAMGCTDYMDGLWYKLEAE